MLRRGAARRLHAEPCDRHLRVRASSMGYDVPVRWRTGSLYNPELGLAS